MRQQNPVLFSLFFPKLTSQPHSPPFSHPFFWSFSSPTDSSWVSLTYYQEGPFLSGKKRGSGKIRTYKEKLFREEKFRKMKEEPWKERTSTLLSHKTTQCKKGDSKKYEGQKYLGMKLIAEMRQKIRATQFTSIFKQLTFLLLKKYNNLQYLPFIENMSDLSRFFKVEQVIWYQYLSFYNKNMNNIKALYKEQLL